MADILIRNLPADIVGRLEARAAGNKRSLEHELREIVIAAASFDVAAAPPNIAERVAIVDHFLALSRHRSQHSSTDFIREDRER